ncbi:MAG: right-handed parallel beta-helix repeat-containing protein [Rhodobacteraceae bacterium]|nr:right-handed parallel beta-helix repeat-containing protein [Paracoccaceae bacterium]
MNKAITDGLIFMPPPFIDGLADWSSEDGTPGSASYDVAANAALVASDPDFGPCLEVQKTTALQKLRYMGDTPVLPGCYLQVTIRFKVLSGLFPSFRVAGWAGGPGGAQVTGLDETGPELLPDTYGRIYSVSAIIGTGERTGVDMVWGTEPVFGHFGLDMTGDDGAVVRIESVRIEDKTSIFHRKLMGWVDVRDYGAVGDGITNDRLAFLAADADAQGREVVVSEGQYFIGSSMTINSPIRFEGQLTMPAWARLLVTSNFEYKTYEAAFGNEREALTRALSALFNYTDHESLDLGGRRIQLDAPIDVHAAVGNKNNFGNRRVLLNGQLEATASSNWDTVTVNSTASYSTSSSKTLSNVTNITNIAIGSLVSGNGVGREVYVAAKDDGAGTITLSQALVNPAGSQSYTFERFQYLLDFSGFDGVSRFQISNVEFACLGRCSGVMLPRTGYAWHIRNSWFLRPKDRGLTSFSQGCYGMSVYNNEWYSNEYNTLAQDRTTVAFNSNANDIKVRGNVAVRFAHFGVMASANHIITTNHIWQGDSAAVGSRTAGIVFTSRNCNSVITGNYIDNCFLEIANEHTNWKNVGAAALAFGALSITGNIFVVSNVAAWFSYLRLAPYGNGHNIDGIAVIGNTFKTLGSDTIEKVDSVDTSNGSFNHSVTKNVAFKGNNFVGVSKRTENPACIKLTQSAANTAWSYSHADKVPFGGEVRSVSSWSANGPIRNGSNTITYDCPYFSTGLGAAGDAIEVNWSGARKGMIHLELRCDLAA